jgi:hypothetical protein
MVARIPDREPDPVRAPRPAPALRPVAPSPAFAAADLTWVELVDHEARTERWIRFGAVVAERTVTRRNRFVAFAPGTVFAYVRWGANGRGTIAARLDILQAVGRGAPRIAVPGVTPGAAGLLRLSGWGRVRQALAAIDAVEASGVALEAVAPAHWRHVHERTAAGLAPHPYTAARQRALRLRQAPAARFDGEDGR